MAKGGKTKTKGKNFTTSEVLRMLDSVEALLPFGAEQWQNVASRFNTNIPAGWTERDGESLKRKFQKLVRLPKPTGTGVCPEEVMRAKRLHYAIEAKIAVVNIHEEDSDIDREAQQVADLVQNVPGQEEPPTVDTSGTNSIEASFPEPTIDQGATNSPCPSLVSTPAASPSLVATARAGMEPSELAALSKALGKRSSSTANTVSLSQTARRRISLDRMISNVESDLQASRPQGERSNDVIAMILAMEERNATREAQDRRDREMYQRQRDEREAANQQMMMMIFARLVGGNASLPDIDIAPVTLGQNQQQARSDQGEATTEEEK